MPNWCANVITISGDREKVKSVLRKIKEIRHGDCKTLFETLIGEDPDPNTGWYESNMNRYGTKWDVSVDDCYGKFDDDRIILRPQTAFSPPVKFCTTLAKEYEVNVDILFFEPMENFSGKVSINSLGETVEEIDLDYIDGVEKFQNELVF
jgi:hypothetical protein